MILKQLQLHPQVAFWYKWDFIEYKIGFSSFQSVFAIGLGYWDPFPLQVALMK